MRKFHFSRRAYVIFIFIALSVLCTAIPAAAETVEVRIEGIKDKLLNNVRNLLSIEKYKNDPELNEFSIKRLHEKAPEEIMTALQPFGYYKPDIRAHLINEAGKWRAVYNIDPGEALRVRSIDLEISGPGADEKEFRRLQKQFPLKPGAVLDQEAYGKAKQSFLDEAFELGYLQGAFTTHEIKISLEKYEAYISLHFYTGPQHYFGKVHIDQNILKPEFVERYLTFKEGDPFRMSALMDLQAALSESEYYGIIEVRPLLDEISDLRVPVEVKLEKNKHFKYSFGIGYGTDTGFRGLLGFQDRWLNSRGHKLSTELRLSQIKQDIIARYIIPVGNPRTDHWDFYSGYASESTSTEESKRFLTGTSYTHKRGTWLETEYLNFQRENFKVGDDHGLSTILMPGVTITRAKGNDPIYPTKGSRMTFDLKGSTQAIGSNVSFVQFRTDIKFITSFWNKGRFILRTDLGGTKVNDFSKLPASLRFFAGGDNSIRGYSYNSLGPRNGGGTVIGGVYLVVGSIEYEQIIYKKWSAAIFYDAGNALKNFSDPIKQGAGIGIRWISPVGPVKIDFAKGLSKPEGKFKIHFNAGAEL